MKILIVEDDEKLAKMLKTAFKKEGISADYITDGELAQSRIELHHTDYDMMILDLMLPGKNGDQICKEIREKGISQPVLVLTAKGGVDNKVSLLDVGADDYMVKPFSFKEVLARVRALTRRPQKYSPNKITVADLVLSPETRQVTRGGKEIKLTLTEFKILEYLSGRAGQVIARDQILDNLWDFGFDSFSNVIDVHIKNLRKKIDKKHPVKLLETVRGVGYRIKSDTI
jgi:DNA-binding response OmpR family regulator